MTLTALSILVTALIPAPRPGTTSLSHLAQSPLPEGNSGIAANYPGDAGIGRDPSVIFHEDFETGPWGQRWNGSYHASNIRLAEEPANVHSGKRALELTVPKGDKEVSNAFVKALEPGFDTVFLRFYSKYEAGFDQTGSSHNGGLLGAISPGLPYATPGIKADGKNKFIASFEVWRDDPKTKSPGELNVYCYHPEQRTQWGDHFFPSGKVLPWTYLPGRFGDGFVSRPDLIPDLDRWICFEFMVQANTPGKRDGRIACWLDGKLIADFMNLRLRDVDTLKINHAEIDLHIGRNVVRANKKWYDDVVIARSYVGPGRPAS